MQTNAMLRNLNRSAASTLSSRPKGPRRSRRMGGTAVLHLDRLCGFGPQLALHGLGMQAERFLRAAGWTGERLRAAWLLPPCAAAGCFPSLVRLRVDGSMSNPFDSDACDGLKRFYTALRGRQKDHNNFVLERLAAQGHVELRHLLSRNDFCLRRGNPIV